MRSRERGFGLIEIIVVGVLIAAVSGLALVAWHNFTGSYINEGIVKGKAEQAADDKKEIDLARAQSAADKADAQTSQSNLASCKQTLTTQNGDIARAQKEAADAQLLAHKNALIAQKAIADKQSAIDENRRIAAAAPQAQACEKELTESDAIGRAVARSLRGVVVSK